MADKQDNTKLKALNNQVGTRVINFRAWHKTLGEWADGSWLDIDRHGNLYVLAVSDVLTITQNTGVKDNEHQDIYEGDILEYVYYAKGYRKKNGQRKIVEIERRVVEWVENAQFIGFNISTRSANNRRVIGNVFENPEMLAEGNGLVKTGVFSPQAILNPPATNPINTEVSNAKTFNRA